MLTSLYTGINGIKTEQDELDVVSNNISNINTYGFKKGRMTFADTLYQSLAGARGSSGNLGGVNAIQLGIGSHISSVDTDFTQGTLTSTGLGTDVAINGKGFFVVSDGTGTYYTRAGNFNVDNDGNLLTSNGLMHVLGKLADSSGNLSSSTGNLQNIVLPYNQKIQAKATDEIDFFCNLNRDASSTEKWLAKDGWKVDGVAATGTDDLNSIDGFTLTAGDAISITGTTAAGTAVSTTFTYGTDGTTVNDLLAAINTAYPGATASLDSQGRLELTATQAGDNSMSINLAGVAYLPNRILTSQSGYQEYHSPSRVITGGSAYTTTAGGNTTPATLTTLLTGTDTPVTEGDITISGTDHNGNAVDTTFTVTATSTFNDLKAAIEAAFTGSTVTMDASGQLVITDNTLGTSQMNVALADGTGTGLAQAFTITSEDTPTAATTSTLLTSLGNGITPGDLVLSGTLHDGTAVNTTFAVTDTSTVADLLAAINSSFTGATATLDNQGRIVLTDNTNGSSQLTLNVGDSTTPALVSTLAVTQEGSDTSSSTVPSTRLSEEVAGQTGTHSTSIKVYDAMGGLHTVKINYTQDTANTNQWKWAVTVDDGLLTPTAGGSGTVSFNDDGSLAGMTYDSGTALTFSVPGTSAMSISLNMGTPDTMDGSTQTSSASTNVAVEQNGYGMGTLSSFTIDEYGIISGSFSNGVTRNIAQIALATVTNENGLTHVGDNLYQASQSSGAAMTAWAGSGNSTSLKSQYLEASNVDLTEEFSRMIVAERALQANSKVVTTADNILSTVIQLKRT